MQRKVGGKWNRGQVCKRPWISGFGLNPLPLVNTQAGVVAAVVEVEVGLELKIMRGCNRKPL